MLILPRILPQDVLSAIQPLLNDDSLEQILPRIGGAIAQLFRAKEALLMFHDENESRPVEAFIRPGEELPEQFVWRFLTEWHKAGIHGRAREELLSRLSALSYSAFSWPFARLRMEEDFMLGTWYELPREYSLFLPMSSQMVVRKGNDPEFFGYFALLFAGFPQISEDVVQLIINLPPLLSEICSRYRTQR